MKIEFLTECTGWDLGFQVEVESEDPKYFYFNDVNERWTCVEKDKEGEDFIVIEEDIVWGGKDTTYNQLMKRARK